MTLRDTLAFRTVLAAAHQRPGADERGCEVVLELLSAAMAVRAALQREFATIGLSEAKVRTLIALFAVDPGPLTAGDLAAHTGTTRSGIAGIVDELQARGIVRRRRDPHDRRGWLIALTDAGRATADAALNRLLASLGRFAQQLPATGTAALPAYCRRLEAGCTQFPSVS